MADIRRMLLLVNAATGLLSVSGAGITYVCPGDSVQAFQNIDFDHCNTRVVLHIVGKSDTNIARWLWPNCTLNVTIIEEYKDRVFLNKNGTITIHNLDHFDQGNYVVVSQKDIDSDTLPSIQEVQINVMVAPSNNCKPMIERFGNKLFASIKDGDCGTPVATLYWKGNGGVSDTNEAMLKITPGNETRTYYACIQGPALQCAKSQMSPDNCSPYSIEANTSRTIASESNSTAGFIEDSTDTNRTMSSEPCSTVGLIAVIIVLGILLILAIVTIVILKIKRRSDLKECQRCKELKQSAEMKGLLQKDT